ncbi:site-specific integrase [Azospirillum sp. 412522]|nr:site-specific integrase [Azospirillum sp. 412522]MBY6265112.1 site-specific integrase [Azospirillum sp. 412522]
MAYVEKRGHSLRVVVRVRGKVEAQRTFPLEAVEEARKWGEEQEAALGVVGRGRGRKRESIVPRRMLQDAPEPKPATDPPSNATGYPLTLREALTRYLSEESPKKKGHEQEKGRIGSWLALPLADKRMVDVTTVELVEWRQTEEQRKGCRGVPISPSTIRNKLAILSAIYQHARSEWGMPELQNPVRGVKLPKNRKAREVRLTPAQREELWRELQNPIRKRYLYYIARLASLTAMRQGELWRIARWESWDKANVIHLTDTKNGDSRDVPLSTEAAKVLREWWIEQGRPPAGPLFPDVVRPGTVVRSYQKVIRAIRKRNPTFPHITFHDLRHIAATDMSKKLSNVLELSAVTGHKSVQVLKRYYNPDAKDLASKLG